MLGLGQCPIPAWLRQMKHRVHWSMTLLCAAAYVMSGAANAAILRPAVLVPYVQRFNATDVERVTNSISNAAAIAWLERNIPLFECPDGEVEELYYFRWWTYRKHIVETPSGYVVTEFLAPVSHAGAFNTISCAAGFHVAEGRWLRDDAHMNDYIRFWQRGHDGKPQPHFHKYSNWLAAAAYDRFLVNGDARFIVSMLDQFVSDYRAWETERKLPDGLFWQYDVRDGMEESICGGRRAKNTRPTINSYMFANAKAIAAIARLANEPGLEQEYNTKALELKRLTQERMWDSNAAFFKVRLENGDLCDAREAIGFVPWMFSLPDAGKGYEAAWEQLMDSEGFHAPFGFTTAERRHPRFRSHGIGTCEWDGAVWPFATCQTLYALANALRDYRQTPVSARAYFDGFLRYVRGQHSNGQPYIGEYLDEVTGDWIDGKNDRSRHYNHSTFADILISGVVGLRPRPDDAIELHPLAPAGIWDWFCLDGVKYHGHMLTIAWDKDGSRYQRGAGLRVLADGKEIAKSDQLARVTGKLP